MTRRGKIGLPICSARNVLPFLGYHYSKGSKVKIASVTHIWPLPFVGARIAMQQKGTFFSAWMERSTLAAWKNGNDDLLSEYYDYDTRGSNIFSPVMDVSQNEAYHVLVVSFPGTGLLKKSHVLKKTHTCRSRIVARKPSRSKYVHSLFQG